MTVSDKPYTGWAQVPGWLIDMNPPSGAIHVYIILALNGTYHPGTATYDDCWPKRSTIARRMDCSVETVKRHLNWLVDHGAIIRTTRYDEAKNGAQTSSSYRVIVGSLIAPGPEGVVTSDPGGRVTSDPGGGSPVTHLYPQPNYPHPFDPEETIATALVSAGSVEPKREDITKGWIDYCRANGVQLTPTQIKRYAAKIKELRQGGISDQLIKTALAEMLKDCVVSRVTLLDNYVSRAQQGPERSPRRLTRTEESMVDNISPDALALLAGSLTNQQQAIGAS